MFCLAIYSIEKMTAVWLLPVVAAEVTAASAGLLVPHLATPHTAMLVLMFGYGLWAYSVPVAMSMLVILLLRLALHKLPHRDMAATGWLALGPMALGHQTHLNLFLAIGGALVVMLTTFWCVVVTRTLKGAWNRSLFVSPCLITGAIPRDFEAGRIGR